MGDTKAVSNTEPTWGLHLANPRRSLGQSHAEEWASLGQLGPNTTFFAHGSYHIYPGYPGHGCPSMSRPWLQALGHWEPTTLVLCPCWVTWVLAQMLPSFQGPGWPPQNVPSLLHASSSNSPP